MKEILESEVFKKYVDAKIEKVYSEELRPALDRHYKLGHKHGLKEGELRDKALFFCMGLGFGIIVFLGLSMFF